MRNFYYTEGGFWTNTRACTQTQILIIFFQFTNVRTWRREDDLNLWVVSQVITSERSMQIWLCMSTLSIQEFTSDFSSHLPG